MRGSYRSRENEAKCRRCLAPLLIAMGLALYGVIHFIINYDEFNNRMNRIAESYDDAFNATTNSSICDGSLDHLSRNKGRVNCPTNKPCSDYCENYFDAFDAKIWERAGMIFLLLAFVVGVWVLLAPQKLNFIENFNNFISDCKRTPNRPVTDGSLNHDVENPLIEGAGGETTSLNSTRRFREDHRQFETRHENTPYNTDERSSITQDEIKDLKNPLVLEDGAVYESEAISRRPESKDISPVTGLPIGNRVIPYDPNQQSTDSQEQIVPAPSALSSSIPFFSHIGSAHKNQGQGNAFTV